MIIWRWMIMEIYILYYYIMIILLCYYFILWRFEGWLWRFILAPKSDFTLTLSHTTTLGNSTNSKLIIMMNYECGLSLWWSSTVNMIRNRGCQSVRHIAIIDFKIVNTEFEIQLLEYPIPPRPRHKNRHLAISREPSELS